MRTAMEAQVKPDATKYIPLSSNYTLWQSRENEVQKCLFEAERVKKQVPDIFKTQGRRSTSTAQRKQLQVYNLESPKTKAIRE